MTTLTREAALAAVGGLIASGSVVKGGATGRLRGRPAPEPEELTLRRVDVAGGPALQTVARTGHLVHTTNTSLADAPALAALADAHTAIPYANWTLHTEDALHQWRFTRKDKAFHTVTGRTAPARAAVHDRPKAHLIAPDDPLFDVLGAGAGGDKRRQVDAFLRVLDAAVRTATRRGLITADQPLTVIDLGCGNAYLTFAAHRFLAQHRSGTRTIGVEQRPELVERSVARAREAHLSGLEFVASSIEDATRALPAVEVDVTLALHACDTATDDALARSVAWRSPVILAAPCCHHDVQRQLRAHWPGAPGPAPYDAMTRHPILLERYADVLTDALRAGLLRSRGWSTTVSEFIDSRHTPRNAMIRAVRNPSGADPRAAAEVAELSDLWRVTPALQERI